MKGYETVFITHPDIEDDKLSKLLKKFKRVIKKSQGELVHEKLWGKRRLAYPIANQTFGVYHVWYLTGSGEMLQELQKQFRYSDEVIRFQTVTAENLDIEARYMSEMLKIQEEEALAQAATSPIKPKAPELDPKQTKTEQETKENKAEGGEIEKQTEVETLAKEPEIPVSNTETTKA